jgi:hypothetical protein
MFRIVNNAFSHCRDRCIFACSGSFNVYPVETTAWPLDDGRISAPVIKITNVLYAEYG